MSDIQDEGIRALDQDEHNADAHAKRVQLRYQNPDDGQWYGFVPNKIGGVDYDYIDVQQTSGTVDTFVFKNGGSGGTTVQTIQIAYTDSTKDTTDTVQWL